MSRRLPNQVKIHLEKARESAILAADVYNKPATKFRSGGFIVLMCIGWTSLFHAIFFKNNIKPFYRDKNRPQRFQKRDGDYRAWELSECLNQYYGTNNPPERKNIEFFIGLRNKIEHRSMPQLDVPIFGECQALLFNFEDLLFREFGAKYALNESLTLALQFSQFRNEEQAKAIAKLHRPLSKDIADYIATFRSGLSNQQFQDLRFSYKFILIEIANREGKDVPAIEFVKYDPDKPEEMERYNKIISLVKPSVREAVNVKRYKAGDISKAVEPVVKIAAGSDKKFNASSHHARACYFYKIRPKKGVDDPRKTETRYCLYDEAHGDYVYTEAWMKFLVNEMKKPGQYEKVMREGQI